jgi:hypothetical protein
MGMSADPIDQIFEHRERVKKPGWRKALPWVSGIVVVAVGIALLIVFWGNTGHSTATPLNPNVPAKDVSQNPTAKKLEPAATKVARRFIETAVARKNLREAYKLTGPQLLGGQSLKSFMTGNISVVPYPVSDVAYAPMKIDYSYPNQALIEVALLPKKSAKGVKSQLFFMELDKINGKWVVNSWVPRSVPFIPSQGSSD